MTPLFCIALTALIYHLRARNLHNRDSVKSGAPPREQRSRSGRPTGPISKIFGHAARVSKQDACRQGSKSGIAGFRITPDKLLHGINREPGFTNTFRDQKAPAPHRRLIRHCCLISGANSPSVQQSGSLRYLRCSDWILAHRQRRLKDIPGREPTAPLPFGTRDSEGEAHSTPDVGHGENTHRCGPTEAVGKPTRRRKEPKEAYWIAASVAGSYRLRRLPCPSIPRI
jgi:hypothetical protein